jgi:hypothetical protein
MDMPTGWCALPLRLGDNAVPADCTVNSPDLSPIDVLRALLKRIFRAIGPKTVAGRALNGIDARPGDQRRWTD